MYYLMLKLIVLLQVVMFSKENIVSSIRDIVFDLFSTIIVARKLLK